MSLPCSIRDLIPQKGKMAFDQILLKSQTDDAQSIMTVGGDNIFLDSRHRLAETAIIEFVNQLNAAVKQYNGTKNGQPAQTGLFVGLQEAAFFRPVYSGDTLTLKAYVVEEVGQVTFVQGTVYRDSEKVAQLITKLYEFADDAVAKASAFPEAVGLPQTVRPLDERLSPAFCRAGLRQKLYTYLNRLEIGTDSIRFEIACPGQFEAFDGHFPGNPVLPGIILLEISKLGLELLSKQSVVYTLIKKMKISRMVLPNHVISCCIKTEPHGLNSAFTAEFKGENGKEIFRCQGYYHQGSEES